MAGDDSPEKPVGNPEGEGKLTTNSESLSASLFKCLSTPIRFGKPKTPPTEQPESSLAPQWRKSFERVRQCNDPVSRELAMRAEIKNFPEFKLSEYRKLYELWDKKPSAFDQLFPTRKWIINTPFWKWTGISEKKGWDILQLLIAPVLIAAIGFGLQRYFTKKDAEQLKAEQQKNQLIAESKAKQDRQLADEKAKQETLVRYLDQMATSIDRNLLKAKPGDKEFIIAQARTVIALQSLDSKRQHLVIQYLQAAGLNQAENIQVDKDGNVQFGKGNKALLYQAQMEKANLKESDLSGAVLIRASLSRADLSRADIHRANLRGAKLGGANLSGANLRGADLRGSDLDEANLSGANLSEANLRGANLRGANLSGADLSHAHLHDTHLSDANLSGANLSGASFYRANLYKANLYRANLDGAHLVRAYLSDANLGYAILLGTTLRDAEELTQQQLKGKERPLICKITLPERIEVDWHRDCKILPKILLERYPKAFGSLKEAQDYVDFKMIIPSNLNYEYEK